MERGFNFGNRKVGDDQPTIIIAEVSANHLHDYKKAEAIVRAACESGVDAVKLQTYTPDTITVNPEGVSDAIKQKYLNVDIDQPDWKGLTYYELYEKAYTPWDWHPGLKKIADEYGVELFSTPFDVTAVDFLEEQGVDAYKVSSFDVVNIPLLKRVAQTRKPVIMSVGMASREELDYALKVLRENGTQDIALLHCISSYPAQVNELNLAKIIDIREKYGVIIGFSDHSLSVDAPVMAVGLGARIIEKHFTLDRELGGVDSKFSLDPSEMKTLVERVRTAERQGQKSIQDLKEEYDDFDEAFGEVFYGPKSKIEIETVGARPTLWVNANIKKGEEFTLANLKVARPGAGVATRLLEEILGKRANQEIKKGTPMSLDFVSK